MSGRLSPDAALREFSDLGLIVAGAKLHTYVSGTPSTPLATYSDGDLLVPNTNPVVASAGGLFGPIYLTPGVAYKYVLTDSADVTLWTRDPVLTQDPPTYQVGDWVPVGGGSGGTSGQAYTTQRGRFIKIGTLVYVTGHLVYSAKGVITGTLQLSGLPFPAAAAPALLGVGAVTFVNLATTWAGINVFALAGTSMASFQGTQVPATGNNVALVTGDITNATILVFTFSYEAAA